MRPGPERRQLHVHAHFVLRGGGAASAGGAQRDRNIHAPDDGWQVRVLLRQRLLGRPLGFGLVHGRRRCDDAKAERSWRRAVVADARPSCVSKEKYGEHILLTVGNLDSYRNIIHASDVASAILTITRQEHGSNYLICNDDIHKVKDLVMQLFEKAGIIIEEKDEMIYDKTLDMPILQISNSSNKIRFDTNITKITGVANNLRNIGWTPKKSIGDVLDELLELQ